VVAIELGPPSALLRVVRQIRHKGNVLEFRALQSAGSDPASLNASTTPLGWRIFRQRLNSVKSRLAVMLSYTYTALAPVDNPAA
jgi:hypothetical protein